MNQRFKCPKCNSVNFTFTGETERCCNLCGTKWDDYGNVVHSQPLSRSEAYEDIINEESQPQATPSLILSPAQQLNLNIADLNETAMKLEELVASQERRLIELEAELESKKQQQNTLTKEAARNLVERLHEQIVDEIEEKYSGEYVDIEIGSYSDSVRLDNIIDLPFMRTPNINDMGDAFIDAGIKVLPE